MDQTTHNLDRIGTASVLHGRIREQQILLDYARSSLAGGLNCLLVSGPPGVGKSAFADSARAWFGGDRNGLVIRGKYEQFQQDVPYAGFAAAFRQVVDRLLLEESAEINNLRQDIKKGLAGNGQVIVSVVPDLAEIVGVQRTLETLPPVEERNRFMKTCMDFVAAVSSRNHPLCLILDDIQWADAASFALLNSILSHGAIKHLLIIATYRSGESRENDDLLKFLQTLREGRHAAYELHLAELDLEATHSLVCDLLRCSSSEVESLSRLVWAKTGGNPFYIVRFLQALVDDKQLAFDPVDNCWVWDFVALKTSAVTENIVEFLTAELLKLPPQTRTFLSRAACIGTSFSLTTCWNALGGTEAEVRSLAQEAERRGFITVLSHAMTAGGAEHWATSLDVTGLFVTFAHDRVQQAARNLIASSDLPRTQLEIGRKLLQSSSPETIDAILPSILSNLNEALDLVEDQEERRALVKLNLTAATHARRGLAYREALHRVRTGLSLSTQDDWSRNYETMLSLCCHGFECAFLVGNFQEAESLFDLLIQHARTDLDRARAWHTKVLLNTSQERYVEAINVAITGLRSFRITVPTRPRLYHLLIELAKTQLLLRGRRASEMLALPEMTDPHHVEAAKLLVAMVPPAYFLNPELFALLGLKVVNLSLRKGNSPMSPAGYVVYSLALTAVLRFPVAGWEFGKLAIDLAERYDLVAFKCKPLLIFAVFVNLWRQPWRSSEPLLKRALDAAVKSGDVQYANYCIIGLGHHAFISGQPVAPLLQHFSSNEAAVRESRDPFAIETLLQWKQCAKAMLGDTRSPSSMSDDQYDESEAEARIRATRNWTLLSYFYIRRIFLESIAGDSSRALTIAYGARALLRFTPGNLIVVDYHFWSGIAAARVLMTRASAWRVKRFLRTRRKVLFRFARFCPDNFEHLAAVLEAEVNAVSKGDLRLFDHAIALAMKCGALHIVGVANERAAEWHEARNQPLKAQDYYVNARKAYEAWGGKSKVLDMERRLQALGQSGQALGFRGVDATRFSAAELAHALNSAAVMEGGIQVQTTELLKLALAALPNAKIALIATSEKECRLEVVASMAGTEPRIEFARAIHGTVDFSRAVVNSVRRTNCTLHLANTQKVERFARCPYLAGAQPALIHAIPIDAAADGSASPMPNGVLCFELAASPDDEEYATGLMDVIGIGLSRCVLNHRLERRLHDVQMRLKSLARFVPLAVQRHIQDAADPSQWERENKEVAVLFIDMDNYTKKCEDLGETIIDLIQQYFSAVLDEVRERGGDMCEMAGDGLMILFQGHDLNTLTQQALESAVAVRSRVAALNERFRGQFPKVTLHIGLHSGTASVGPTKLEGIIEHRWVYDATGPTVNVAARIGDLATDGSILMSMQSAGLVQQGYAFRDLGCKILHNVSEPVRVLELQAGPVH